MPMREPRPVDRHRFRRRQVQMLLLGLTVGSSFVLSIVLYSWTFNLTGSSPLGNQSTDNDQATYQEVIKTERGALISGKLFTPQKVKAEVDKSAKFTVIACGPSAYERDRFCRSNSPPTGSSAPVVNEVQVGSRIGVKATADADAEVTQLSSDVQPVIEPTDVAIWSWNVKPKESGRFNITLTVTTLRQDKDEPLLPDRTVTIPLEVDLTVTYGIKSTSGSLAIWIPIIVSVLTLFGLGEFLRRRRTSRSESGIDQGSMSTNAPRSRRRTKKGKSRRR